LFLFPTRPLLPFLTPAPLRAAASDGAPFARLDLPTRVHAEDEERDDPDHAPRNRVRLPCGLTDVHGRRGLVVDEPRVRFRCVVDVHLERLVPLTGTLAGASDLSRRAGSTRSFF